MGISRGFAIYPHVSKVNSLEALELVLNLTTRACGGTVVYPSVYQGVKGGILGVFVFYPVYN